MIRPGRGLACAALLAAIGCGDDSDSGYACGAGTVAKDGVCVADAVDAGDAGKPHVVPDAGTDTGTGTNDSGSATPDTGVVAPTLKCGAGTIEVEGACVPVPLPKLKMDGFAITQLSLSTRGQVLTGADTDPELSVYHPIDLTVAVRYEGDPATIPLVLALGEVSTETVNGQGLCLLGGVAVEHTGHGEVVAHQRLFLSQECLKDNTSAATNTIAEQRRMHPILMIDPDDVLDEQDPLPEAIMFAPAEQKAALDAASAYSTALTEGQAAEKLAGRDVTLTQCRGGASGEPGSCALELDVRKSTGVDFELTDVKLESAVAVLNRCLDSQAALDNYASGVGLPTGYVCNRSIVRGLNEQGEPLPEGNVKDYTYGAADVEADTTVTAFGLDDSPVESADELMAMGTMTPDGFKLNVNPEDISNNALGANGSYTVRYFLRSASSTLVDGAQDRSLAAAIARQGGLDDLVADKTLLPIYLHEQGEQAKAEGESLGGQNQTGLEETVSIPQTPTEYSHGLYVENDCGRFNDPVGRPAAYRPGTPACNSALNPRDELLYGALQNENDFYVVACVTGVGNESLPASDYVHNNCVERPLRVTRVVPREARWAAANPNAEPDTNPFAADPDDVAAPGFTQDPLFGASDADGWAQNYDWDNKLGNDAVSLNVHAHTRNALSLMAGASTDNEVKLFLASDLLDFRLDIVRAWAQAAARTAIVGSYYDWGLEYFGTKYIGERKEAEFHKEWDWNVTKEWSKSKSIFVKVAWVDVGFKAQGQVGFRIDLDVVSRDTSDPECKSPECNALKTLYNGSKTIGEASLTLTPYGNVKANVYAAVSLQVVRAGAAGEITLAELNLPAKAALNWGFVGSLQAIQDGQLRLAAWANLEAKSRFLNGRLYLFADNRTIEWCSTWWIYYPCGFGWNTFWDYTIASWGGWSYNQMLWASPVYKGTLSKAGLSVGTVAALDGNTWFKVQPVHSGRCVDAVDRLTHQWECHGQNQQRWRFIHEANDVYRVVNQRTNKCLDVEGNSTNNGANVHAWDCHGGNNQKLKLEKRGDGYVMKFVHSNRCMDISGASQGNGGAVIQWDCHGGNNQLFRVFQ